jgi:hypothetical protein
LVNQAILFMPIIMVVHLKQFLTHAASAAVFDSLPADFRDALLQVKHLHRTW